MTLFIILACLFVGLAILVTVAEKYGKPIEPEQQSKYSKIIIVLVFLVLFAALFKSI